MYVERNGLKFLKIFYTMFQKYSNFIFFQFFHVWKKKKTFLKTDSKIETCQNEFLQCLQNLKKNNICFRTTHRSTITDKMAPSHHLPEKLRQRVTFSSPYQQLLERRQKKIPKLHCHKNKSALFLFRKKAEEMQKDSVESLELYSLLDTLRLLITVCHKKHRGGKTHISV